MKKYRVTFYYRTSLTVNVEANSEEEALEKASDEQSDDKYNYDLLARMQEGGYPDIEQL